MRAATRRARWPASCGPGKTLVIWGEDLGRGPGAEAALASLLRICEALECSAESGGAFSVPTGSNARGVREVGCLPGFGPGFATTDRGRDLERIKDGLRDGELDGVILVHADPIRELEDGPGWAEALRRARTVVAISNFDDESTKAADVVLPAEAYAEKEGTVTHPDGRLQRLRPSVPRPGLVRPMWQVLAELIAIIGDETGIESAPDALAAIANEVPFYAGLTPGEIGGTGVRWQTREAAASSEPTAPAGRSPLVDSSLGRARTVGSGLGPIATFGPARSPSATPRCASSSRSRRSSSRRRTPIGSGSPTATRSRCGRTGRACAPASRCASGCVRAPRS